MRRLALRIVRKLLRRLDRALEPPPQISPKGSVSTNRRETEIEAFLSSLEPGDAAAYLRQHKSRIVRTLSLLPLGDGRLRALELGSYLHMAAAMERVLDYRSVRPAYYGPPRRDIKTLAISGQPAFTAEIDLFDAESDPFPYADSSFDLVLCCELIEHLVHDPMHMLLECGRVLADNGLLMLTTPNAASLMSVAATLGGKHNPQVFSQYPPRGNRDTPHVREYTPFEIIQALRAAGFEIENLITERMDGAQHSTWVLDILTANGFDTSLRGEQIYCLARKSQSGAGERFPPFLYSVSEPHPPTGH